ncbi:MAG: NYN domain-containing protein [Pseudomonadales bacterium]
MKDLDTTKTIAVLIDAENAQHGTIGPILDELSKHGHVVAKNAYGDWSSPSLNSWPGVLERLAIRPHHQFARTSGKNATDIAMVIDAMDMFHSEGFDAFALVSSDADFAGLASRLRRGGKHVFGFGEEKTPVAFRNACDDFIVTSLLVTSGSQEVSTTSQPRTDEPSNEVRRLIEMLKSAADEYGDADGWTPGVARGLNASNGSVQTSIRKLSMQKLLQLIDKFHEHFELRKVPRGDGMQTSRERRDA